MFEKISVNDESPQEEKFVNVFQNNEPLSHRTAQIIGGDWYDEQNFELDNVTFWLKELGNEQ